MVCCSSMLISLKLWLFNLAWSKSRGKQPGFCHFVKIKRHELLVLSHFRIDFFPIWRVRCIIRFFHVFIALQWRWPSRKVTGAWGILNFCDSLLRKITARGFVVVCWLRIFSAFALLVVCLWVGWLVGCWLVGWLVGCLVGWLVGWCYGGGGDG